MKLYICDRCGDNVQEVRCGIHLKDDICKKCFSWLEVLYKKFLRSEL
jgi:hypothetical protein